MEFCCGWSGAKKDPRWGPACWGESNARGLLPLVLAKAQLFFGAETEIFCPPASFFVDPPRVQVFLRVCWRFFRGGWPPCQGSAFQLSSHFLLACHWKNKCAASKFLPICLLPCPPQLVALLVHPAMGVALDWLFSSSPTWQFHA